MTKPWVVVIGGGHNGLVCATYLAKAGYPVQILEARDSVGGATSTINFADGFKVSGLAHVLHSLCPEVVKELDLNTAGLNVGTPVETISLDPGGLHVTLGVNAVTGQGISAKDASAYKTFKQAFHSYAKALEPLIMNKPPRLKDMDSKDKLTFAKLGWKLRFGLGRNAMREFMRLGGINIYDVLDEYFDDARIKGAIAMDACLGHHMGPRTPTTVLTYLQRLRGEIYGPSTLPPGGMGQITLALLKAAEKAGVSIRTGAKVSQVKILDGCARGIVLENGETIEAEIVVSNADAKTTFLKLVGTKHLDAMFAHRVHSIRTNGNVAKIHFTLNQMPQIKGLSSTQLHQRMIIAPDMHYVEHAFNHAKYGEFSTNPILELTIPSVSDSELAPDNKHVMSINASFAPRHLRTGWQQGRKGFLKRVVEVIGGYFTGFSDQITASQILTPEDIENEYHITGGHWHHGELSIDQSFMMRPVHGSAQYDTPIDGLFLCGAAAHPGGGVTGIPGRSSARRILSMSRT